MNALIKSLKFLTAILLVTAFLVSCSKSNTQGRYVPKDATFVLVVNGNSLSTKLPWAEIKNNALFKQAIADSTIESNIKNILDNPENSGIDTKQDLVFFVNKDSVSSYIGFEGTVKDAAKFKAFNEKIPLHDKAIEKGDITLINSYSTCVGWNKEKFIYVFKADQLNDIEERYNRYGSRKRSEPASLSSICTSLFDLSSSSSLAKEERFSNVVSMPGDVHYWVNGEYFYKTVETSSVINMFNLEVLYKGNISAGAVNFDNGKITVNGLNYYSDDLMKVFKQFKGGSINQDLIKRISSKDVNMLLSLNYKPEAIKELLKLFNTDGILKAAIAPYGVKLEELLQSNGGDVMLAISDFKVATDTSNSVYVDKSAYQIQNPKPSMNFIFATTIGDKEAFNKVLKGADKFGNSTFGESTKDFVYKSDDKLFALSNTEANATNYLAGKTSNTYGFLNQISNANIVWYVNIQSLLKASKSMYENQVGNNQTAQLALQLWDNILIYGGDIKDDALHTTIDINLLDKNVNSLVQLNNYSSKMFTIAQEEKLKRQQRESEFIIPDEPVTEDAR